MAKLVYLKGCNFGVADVHLVVLFANLALTLDIVGVTAP